MKSEIRTIQTAKIMYVKFLNSFSALDYDHPDLLELFEDKVLLRSEKNTLFQAILYRSTGNNLNIF